MKAFFARKAEDVSFDQGKSNEEQVCFVFMMI
jgi:hypothetical protein